MLASGERRKHVRVQAGDLGPHAALLAVARGGPEAGEPLVRWLWRRRWIRAAQEEVEDVVQWVGFRLLRDASEVVESLRRRHGRELSGSAADRALARYVRAMARNLYATRRRRRPTLALDPFTVATPGHDEGLLDVRAVVRALDRGWRLAAQTTPSAAQGLRLLRRRSFTPVSMEELVAHAMDSEEETGTFEAVRDRLYKRLGRARVVLKRSLRRLAATGQLSSSTAIVAAGWVDDLLRRRRAS